LITLTRFAAAPTAAGVSVVWETASEIATAGFHLWRSDRPEAGYARITPALLPGCGGPTRSAAYAYTDNTAASGQAYFYKLEEVDIFGLSAFYGPVESPADGSARSIFRSYLPFMQR
jgi:hypothetical protein